MTLWNHVIGYRDGKTRFFRAFFPHYQIMYGYHRKMNCILAVCRWFYFLLRGICGSCEGKRRVFYTTSNQEFEVHCPSCKGTLKRGSFFNEFNI